jgi:hypothetical protein
MQVIQPQFYCQPLSLAGTTSRSGHFRIVIVASCYHHSGLAYVTFNHIVHHVLSFSEDLSASSDVKMLQRTSKPQT